MSDPYIGEIRMFGGNFAPAGWAFCHGQTLSIAENDVLFQLIGTTYGGDGQVTFNLPDLRGRIPVHMGTGTQGQTFQIGEMSGTEQVTLTVNQIPNHTHAVGASTSPGHIADPANAYVAADRDFAAYASGTPTPMAADAVGFAGGSQPHDNMPPYLCVSFIISLFGIFPSPT